MQDTVLIKTKIRKVFKNNADYFIFSMILNTNYTKVVTKNQTYNSLLT